MVRIFPSLAWFVLATQATSGAVLPDARVDAIALKAHDSAVVRSAHIVAPDHTLERRRGGGGRGGGSSGGGSSGGGRVGSSGGSSGGSSSRTSSTSSVGGSTSLGSGPARSYGRGGYYGGGAAVPYSAGSNTPKGLRAAPLIAPVAILAIMPGLWLYSAYPYYYNNPYRFYNRSAVNRTDNNNEARDLVSIVLRQEATGANETLPVVCLCGQNLVCGCDENDDQGYIDDLVGDGNYANLNKSLVTVSDVNGTRSLVLNGTLPRGTTAPGGVDDAAASLTIGKYAGYWAMGLIVLYSVFL